MKFNDVKLNYRITFLLQCIVACLDEYDYFMFRDKLFCLLLFYCEIFVADYMLRVVNLWFIIHYLNLSA